jgi:O-antigen/teichoic acid export membrane protein
MGSYFGFVLLGQVAASVREPVDKIILASFASMVWVGHYGIALRLASLVLLVCSFFYGPFVAATGALNAAGDWK